MPVKKLMKLPKTIQLDVSDIQIFEHTATPGEWAVTGSFSFSDSDPATLNRKQRLAFNAGWVGIESGGYSTLVQVTTATQGDFDGMVETLAALFVRDFGAPNIEAARPVARDEVLYASSLCEFDDSTLLTLSRDLGDEGLREVVRPIADTASGDELIKIWEVVDD
jgi:hypothetical protein